MKRNFDRFNGVTEEQLYQKCLDDVVDYNLDVIVVNINPGLYSVHKGHHYSGPGNHFWRCMAQSGLTDRVLKSFEDRKVLDFRIGLMNMSEKPNIKSCQDLTPEEIKVLLFWTTCLNIIWESYFTSFLTKYSPRSYLTNSVRYSTRSTGIELISFLENEKKIKGLSSSTFHREINELSCDT